MAPRRSYAGHCQSVQAARKEQHAYAEKAASPGHRIDRQQSCLGQYGHNQHSKRVDEMVEHRALVDAEQVSIQPAAKSVRAEGPEHHAEREQHRGDRCPVHASIVLQRVRAASAEVADRPGLRDASRPSSRAAANPSASPKSSNPQPCPCSWLWNPPAAAVVPVPGSLPCYCSSPLRAASPREMCSKNRWCRPNTSHPHPPDPADRCSIRRSCGRAASGAVRPDPGPNRRIPARRQPGQARTWTTFPSRRNCPNWRIRPIRNQRRHSC